MRRLALAVLASLVAGCASVSNPDPRDPYEGYNRAMYKFNDEVDKIVLKPTATIYHDLLPEPARNGVRNFFANIADVFIGVNNLLQGKPASAVSDWMRVVVNTTFGVAGLNDFASQMGLEKHNEDFGQTFGVWGAKTGPYLVLPFFGPSDARDAVGLGLDLYSSPVSNYNDVPVRNSLTGLRVISERSELLGATSLLQQAALDKYAFARDFYLQRRRSLVYDGNPPRERLPED